MNDVLVEGAMLFGQTALVGAPIAFLFCIGMALQAGWSVGLPTLLIGFLFCWMACLVFFSGIGAVLSIFLFGLLRPLRRHVGRFGFTVLGILLALAATFLPWGIFVFDPMEHGRMVEVPIALIATLLGRMGAKIHDIPEPRPEGAF
ncbi:MAG: hypothetical protein SFU56_14360 [Capsulimonadales bacterium]|nr:hypothetical protein [Capsulimonadales bacterium]